MLKLPRIELFEQILPDEVKEDLMKLSELRSLSNWSLADISVKAYTSLLKGREQGQFKGVHNYHLWSAIHHYSGVSPRRVEKLTYMAQTYTPEVREKYRKYPFGYFEKAFELNAAHRIKALDFLDFYIEENGFAPAVGDFKFLYRKHILGETTDADAVAPPMPAEDVPLERGATPLIVFYDDNRITFNFHFKAAVEVFDRFSKALAEACEAAGWLGPHLEVRVLENEKPARPNPYFMEPMPEIRIAPTPGWGRARRVVQSYDIPEEPPVADPE